MLRFKRLFALIKKEFLSIKNDPKSRVIVLVPPIIQLLIFANALTMEVKNIDLMFLDNSKTQESRELLQAFGASKWFKSVSSAKNMQEINNAVKIQQIDAAIIINSEFSNNLKTGKRADVQLILDGRNTSSAAAINGYATQIAAQYSKNKAHQRGIRPSNITIETRNYFNPNVNYQWYLLSSLIVILALMVTLVLTSLSISRERELGTFEQLIVSPYTSFEILLGKTLPPVCISLVLTSVMSAIATGFFKMPFEGSFLLFMGACFVALLSFVGVGLFISSISKTQQQAILGAFAFMMPAVLLSGFISPIEDMPVFLQHLTQANPIRFFMNIARGLFFKGTGFYDVFLNLIPLMIIAALTLTLASRTFKKNLE